MTCEKETPEDKALSSYSIDHRKLKHLLPQATFFVSTEEPVQVTPSPSPSLLDFSDHNFLMT